MAGGADCYTLGHRVGDTQQAQEAGGQGPAMPVKITTTMVMAATPPLWALSSTAMGVVTDLGRREAVIVSSRPKTLQRARVEPTEAQHPARHPSSTGRKLSRSTSLCR